MVPGLLGQRLEQTSKDCVLWGGGFHPLCCTILVPLLRLREDPQLWSALTRDLQSLSSASAQLHSPATAARGQWDACHGLAPSLCGEHTFKPHSLSLFIAGSRIHIPQDELLCVVHCTAASPAVSKVGNKNRFKLPISANLNYNGGFVGQNVAPEGAALWQSSLCMELQEG